MFVVQVGGYVDWLETMQTGWGVCRQCLLGDYHLHCKPGKLKDR